MAERPAMDGRAGLSVCSPVAPWTATPMPEVSARCAMAHVAPNARPGMAGPAVPAPVVLRQGWRHEPKAQRIAGFKEAMRLRTTGSRMAERPAMDGRAGLSVCSPVAPWTATPMPEVSARCAMAHVAPNARPGMAGPAVPAPVVLRQGWRHEPKAQRI